MCEHCTLQKGCFYLFTFLPFTFLVIIQLHSFTISSTGPFLISERCAIFLLIVFFVDIDTRYFNYRNFNVV